MMSITVKGAIAAGDQQTADAGAAMFARNGNAVDAAIAAAFASFVAEPSLVSIGGGGIAMLVNGQSGDAAVYDFFSDMPSGPLVDNADFRKVVIDFGATQQPFYIGRASAAIPGVVAGLCQMATDHASLPLPTLLEPAVQLARNGIILSEQLYYAYTLLKPILSDTPELAALFFPHGEALRVGERIHFPQLASTLELLGQEGAALFSQGAIARKIVADQAAYGGLITAADLANYQVLRLQPIRLDYRGYTILLPPPSSVGGVLITFALKLLRTVDVGQFAHNSCAHLRMLAEVMRLTNIARSTWEASDGAAAERVHAFLHTEHVTRYAGQLAATLQGGKPPAEPRSLRGPSATTHLSTADGDGRMVSITTSAGEMAGFLVDDTGITLNNMLGELDLHPNGFHTLPPGTRIATMMTPVVVLRDGIPVVALGSGGSNRIRSAILQVLSNMIDFGFAPDAAVNAPRVHFEDGILQIEGGIDASVVTALNALNYATNHWPDMNMFFGGAHIVARQGDELVPIGDQRRGGSVACR